MKKSKEDCAAGVYVSSSSNSHLDPFLSVIPRGSTDLFNLTLFKVFIEWFMQKFKKKTKNPINSIFFKNPHMQTLFSLVYVACFFHQLFFQYSISLVFVRVSKQNVTTVRRTCCPDSLLQNRNFWLARCVRLWPIYNYLSHPAFHDIDHL